MGKVLLMTAVFAILAAGCDIEPQRGILPSKNTGGPVVRYDIEAEPIPEIPFPNDAATIVDKSSPTGRRLNISEHAPTKFETGIRQNLNRSSGFGIYSPIWVSFTKPLDVADVIERHGDNDIANDAVYLLNITKGSPEFGGISALDLGRG
ncbi:MAG: hypothetical protein FJ088_04510, partial [Deltaproteobacteria bacterium]|nr:hypothetical protein [Deltaproteobacteria bacterium]